ncbi:hypothetical protein [Gramella sp. KN1008]|uniref:hypothetical protein n=1 Tax=Gramella sp. KN1008 TaxID=2529298 RepID=UPI00103B0ACB|nr:hypothetical protein [Gramella sp. KN1008]TBW28282.1 hypothetical protein EZJ28_05920 [Gramella sp. KN1008]
MNKEFRISTGEELIQFMKAQNLNSKQICEVLQRALILFADETKPPEVLIQEFREYWEHFKHTNERPLFLGLNLDVKE